MDRQLLRLAADLHRRHRPFVMATVVWARAPSSGKPGGTAIIEPDGTIHGWIGGACAEPAVLREARRVLNDGVAKLMYMGPAEELDGHRRDGIVTVPIACASEGSMEIFMEPVLPQPHLVVFGKSPAVQTLARLADALDWAVTVVDDEGEAVYPEAAAVVTLEQWESVTVDENTPIVVATQGHYDEPALELALASPAPYIGMVSSATRAETVLGYLRDRGYDDIALRRIESPAGVDLGAIEHREIAVAVLAQLVARRASGAFESLSPTPAPGPVSAIDPVCGMEVEIATARFSTTHDDGLLYFCCPACLQAFEAEPAAFSS